MPACGRFSTTALRRRPRASTTLDEVLRVVAYSEAMEKPSQTPAGTAAGVTDTPSAPVHDVDTSGRRVLVVEDSPTIVSVVKYFLELEGFEVLVAEDGVNGLEVALREVPDVIVSDVQMPGMTGVEMVRRLRANDGAAQIRVLMLTSEASIESETEGLAAGADDYILKPVEPRRLAARVKALLGRARPYAA